MAIDTPRRLKTLPDSGPIDAPEQATEQPAPYADERSFLGSLLEALEKVGGFNAAIRQPYGMGTPYLRVQGGGTMGNGEDIRLRRVAKDGSLRAVWQWGEDLPTDPAEAAEAIGRVINPEM